MYFNLKNKFWKEKKKKLSEGYTVPQRAANEKYRLTSRACCYGLHDN